MKGKPSARSLMRRPGAGCGGPGRPSQQESMPTEDERGRNTAHSRSPVSYLRKIRMSHY